MDTPENRSTSHAPRPRTSQEQLAFMVRLAGGLAHEIKNPLSTIAINLALLEEAWGKPGSGRGNGGPELTPREQRSLHRIKTLQREVGRMEAILEDFLQFVRGAQINRAPRDLAAILRELLDFVEPENVQAGIRHVVDLAVGMPLVMLDETAIKQSLLNLLKNAREAMHSGGELLVRVRREGNWAEVLITDTGVGMSPDALEHCFDEYWSDKKGGTGLGLPTTRRIIEEHGGTVHVVSQRGIGTSFSIYLPLLVEIARGAAGERAVDVAAEVEARDVRDEVEARAVRDEVEARAVRDEVEARAVRDEERR